jgi:hypothetical protein
MDVNSGSDEAMKRYLQQKMKAMKRLPLAKKLKRRSV